MQSRRDLWTVLAAVGVLAVAAPGCGRRLDAGPQPNLARGKELRTLVAAAAEPAADASAPASEDSGGRATLSARFRYVGTAAKPAPIDVNKDMEVCGKHPLHVETLEVGPDGGVANIVVWLRTRVPVAADALPDGEVVLDNKDCRFEPHVAVMTTKQKLRIKNSDPVGHNSNGVMMSNSPFNPIIPAGQSVDVNLPKEESLPAKVGCNIHPWMGAYLVIRNDTYAAVSDKDGVLSLKDLPAGRDLEFQLWQERVGFLKDVEVSGVKVDSKGRFKLKLAAGQDQTLEFKVVIK